MQLLLAAALALLLVAAQPSQAQALPSQYSSLWGVNGELWKPAGRVADFSYAGYSAGERPIPRYPVAVNVLDFGAKGDNFTDDTQAFIQAIAAASQQAYLLTTQPCGTGRCPIPDAGFGNDGASGVAVLAPAGTYRISRMLEIVQSNVVLRGEGVGKTTLFFPKGLKAVYGPIMQWEFAGGYLNILGPEINSTHQEHLLARVTAPAARGTRRIQVSTTAGFKVGSWVRLFATAPMGGGAWRRKALAAVEPHTPEDQPATEGLGGRRALQGLPGYAPLTAAAAAAWASVEHLSLGEAHIHEGSPAGTAGPAAGTAAPAAAAAAAAAVVSPASVAGSMDAYLYSENLLGAASSGSDQFKRERIRFASRVAAIGPGWVELERPLIHDLRAGWQLGVYSFQQQVQHSGYEDFSVQFAHSPFDAHFIVRGFNALYYVGAANCWARNLRVLNADCAGEAIHSDFVTFTGIAMGLTAPRWAPGVNADTHGHHGLWAAHSTNILITQFNVEGVGGVSGGFIHDITLDVFASECVVSDGRGVNVNLDSHRGGINYNLWTNVNLGHGKRPFASGGDQTRGANAARGNVWWNLIYSGTTALKMPACTFGPDLTFVGNFQPNTAAAGNCAASQWFVEKKAPLLPANLHTAMQQTRAARLAPSPPPPTTRPPPPPLPPRPRPPPPPPPPRPRPPPPPPVPRTAPTCATACATNRYCSARNVCSLCPANCSRCRYNLAAGGGATCTACSNTGWSLPNQCKCRVVGATCSATGTANRCCSKACPAGANKRCPA